MPSIFFVEFLSLAILASLILVPLSWIALYRRGAEARDLIFWGAISVVVPLLGPLAALVFALRLKKDKSKSSMSETT